MGGGLGFITRVGLGAWGLVPWLSDKGCKTYNNLGVSNSNTLGILNPNSNARGFVIRKE